MGDNQLNVTADTKVLVIDTSADGDAIGQTYTYGTTTFRKANKVGSSYQNNVAYILDEDISNGKADLELLIIDNTGSFDWLNDSSDPTPSTPDTITKDNITITGKNVDAVTIATARVATGKVQVVLNIKDKAVTGVTGKSVVKVDGVAVADTNVTSSVVTNQLQIIVNDEFVKDNSKITIDLSGITFTKA